MRRSRAGASGIEAGSRRSGGKILSTIILLIICNNIHWYCAWASHRRPPSGRRLLALGRSRIQMDEAAPGKRVERQGIKRMIAPKLPGSPLSLEQGRQAGPPARLPKPVRALSFRGYFTGSGAGLRQVPPQPASAKAAAWQKRWILVEKAMMIIARWLAPPQCASSHQCGNRRVGHFICHPGRAPMARREHFFHG